MLLGSDINTASWETHATVSADGNTLFFVSDREGGIGKRDIYKCVKLAKRRMEPFPEYRNFGEYYL
jgi:hypothetical protein